MKTYAVFLRMKDEGLSAQYRAEHLDYLARLKDEGRVWIYGRFTDGAGGLVIYKGESVEEVTKLVQEDPYIIHGARTYEIHEWAVVTDGS